LLENDLLAIEGKLGGLRVLTVADVVQRGADDIGQLCQLKIGPKIRLEKGIKRLNGGVGVSVAPSPPPAPAAVAAVPADVRPPMQAAPEVAVVELKPLSADLQSVRVPTLVITHHPQLMTWTLTSQLSPLVPVGEQSRRHCWSAAGTASAHGGRAGPARW
jgi:hypothetical protein